MELWVINKGFKDGIYMPGKDGVTSTYDHFSQLLTYSVCLKYKNTVYKLEGGIVDLDELVHQVPKHSINSSSRRSW